jgi:hypothetical protein
LQCKCNTLFSIETKILFVRNSVIQLPSGSFKSPSDAAEFYLDKLEKGGAKKTRQFQVELVTYTPCLFYTKTTFFFDHFVFLVIPNSKVVHVLSHSEYPASSFALADYPNSQMLVADNTFTALMGKLKNLRVFDIRSPKMEARGTRLEYQDFIINLATVNQSQTTKGLILEVNHLLPPPFKSLINLFKVAYVPMDEIRDGYCLIQEFLQSFLSMSKQAVQKLITEQLNQLLRSLKEKKDAEYTPSITLLQYLDILNNMRKHPNE